MDQVKGATVPAIFAETTTNPDLINTVANDAGVKVAEQPLFVEGPGGPGNHRQTPRRKCWSPTPARLRSTLWVAPAIEGGAPI